MTLRRLTADCETFELAAPFATSKGRIDAITVLSVTITEGAVRGRGESVPSAAQMATLAQGRALAQYARDQVMRFASEIAAGLDPHGLQRLLPPGPARNALDCALWDLHSKLSGESVATAFGISMPAMLDTAQSIALGPPDQMGKAAARSRNQPLIKIKLGGSQDREVLRAVRANAPDPALIVDANEAWSLATLDILMSDLQVACVSLIEQPLPAGRDEDLKNYRSPIRLCADESCHDRADLDRVAGSYQAINVKLDKAGGLTEAVALAREAHRRGLSVMVGCMAGTSLSMAPAALVGAISEFVDLDGPLLLKHDRPEGFRYIDGKFESRKPALWG